MPLFPWSGHSHDSMPEAPPAGFAPALDAKLAFLRQASSYPEPAYRVEAVETHMSWVFLTDAHAYKLKKPVRQALFDFRSVEARRHYCEEEVRLNRRLAPGVYLGIVALAIDAQGHLQLGGPGTVIDWLVKMRRLPARHMLDYAIREGTIGASDMRRVAARLAAFYRSGVAVPIDPAVYRQRFLSDIERNRLALSRSRYRLPSGPVHRLCEAQRTVLERRSAWFDERVSSGRIVEGHGDLRPEHVCLFPEVLIIDCLEFCRELRVLDTADELGYLALECERLGAPAAGALLLQAYGEFSGDRPCAGLVHFYQAYRGAVRARIAIEHLDEDRFRYSAEWRRRAADYLRLAQAHQASINSTIDPPS